MSNLLENLRADMKRSMTTDKERLGVLRVIVGETQRSVKKDLSDDEIIKMLKKMEKSEVEMGDKGDSRFISVLREYIPQMLSREDIEKWIQENVDFTALKNKMQAVGLVKKEFGEQVDGKLVQEVARLKLRNN